MTQYERSQRANEFWDFCLQHHLSPCRSHWIIPRRTLDGYFWFLYEGIIKHEGIVGWPGH